METQTLQLPGFSNLRDRDQRIFPSVSCDDCSDPLVTHLGQLSSGRTPRSSDHGILRRTLLSRGSTVDTLSNRDPLSEDRQKEFVPTHHLGLDSFPQFPTTRQSPSSPLFSDAATVRMSATDERHRIPQSPRFVTLSEICRKLVLLVRAILLEYRFFWLSIVSLVLGFRVVVSVLRYGFVIGVACLVWPFAWRSVKTLFACVFSPPSPRAPSPLSRTVTTRLRLRDLPQNLPPETPPPVVLVTQPKESPRIPPWLRWYPSGNFGEAAMSMVLSPRFRLPQFLQQPRTRKTVSDHCDLLNSAELIRMSDKLKLLVIELCNRLLFTEAQDAALSSGLAELGLHYVVQHPLIAFYSLDFNDTKVVNLNDRHLPLALIQLCNSAQQGERQIGSQMIQMLLQRRQLEKFLMLSPSGSDQRLACLRRLSEWHRDGLDKSFSAYSLALTSPPMTDGDLVHHLLFTFLTQQLPSLHTDILSHTFLSVLPKEKQSQTATAMGQPQRTSLSPVLSIQKLPTPTPSVSGTFYKIVTCVANSSTTLKPTILEVSWDDEFGIFKGVAIFLLCLKLLRPHVELQAGLELIQLLED